jgi:hypothetical protein
VRRRRRPQCGAALVSRRGHAACSAVPPADTDLFLGVAIVSTTRGGLPLWLGYPAYIVAAASTIATLGIFVEREPFTAGGMYSLAVFTMQLLWWSAASLALLLPRVSTPGELRGQL